MPHNWGTFVIVKRSCFIIILLYLGELRGKWEMFLITPDQKILRNPKDLKLYIAKSGAVIDSNIVNFALPKKTAKVRNKNSRLNSQKCRYK